MDITAIMDMVTGKAPMNYPGFEDPKTPPTLAQKNYPEFEQGSNKLDKYADNKNYPGFDNINITAPKGNGRGNQNGKNAASRDYQAAWEEAQQVSYPKLNFEEGE